MFSRNAVKLGVSTFAYFLKTDKAVKGLRGGELFQKGAKLYKKLSKAQKAALKVKALKVKVAKKPVKTPLEVRGYGFKKVKRTVTPFARFMKRNINKVDAPTGQERLRAVAKLWSIRKAKLANAAPKA